TLPLEGDQDNCSDQCRYEKQGQARRAVVEPARKRKKPGCRTATKRKEQCSGKITAQTAAAEDGEYHGTPVHRWPIFPRPRISRKHRLRLAVQSVSDAALRESFKSQRLGRDTGIGWRNFSIDIL